MTLYPLAALAALWLAPMSVTQAQPVSLRPMGQDLTVSVRMELDGETAVTAWSRRGRIQDPVVLAQAIRCRSALQADPYGTGQFRCTNALHRSGLGLEGVVDLSPILQVEDVSGVTLWINAPNLGFASSSLPMQRQEWGTRASQTAHFEPGEAPGPIQVRFGFPHGRWIAIVTPLLVLALALAAAAFLLARAGWAGLSRSVILLGMILWMGAASQLQSGALIRILLYGNPLANLAALLVEFWPPLFCVSAGVALGSRNKTGKLSRAKFGEVFWAFVVLPLIVTCAVGMLPPVMDHEWAAAAWYLAATPALVLLRRQWLRTTARSSVRQLTGGELAERVSAMAARVGRTGVRVFVSFSARSQVAAAFALPGKSIFFTAPLVRSLNKREVDAVAAHELYHFNHSPRGIWMALALAMVVFELPVRDALLPGAGGMGIAMLLPLTVLLVALRNARVREYAADAGAAALTADPRAMISSLARVARNNGTPLDMSAAVEWISSHPSTRRRIRALAAAARLPAEEVETLCATGLAGDSYEIPVDEPGGLIFTPGWQRTNSAAYGWTVLLASAASGLLAAWLALAFPGAGLPGVAGGVVLACLLTKGIAAAMMVANWSRLRRRLAARLGVAGQLVGLSIGSEPRLYGGFRFSDAGLLRFEGGMLCYHSERITIRLNPADVSEVGMVAASPSTWLRNQPLVRFRIGETGEEHAFVLHPVTWLPARRRLLRRIEQWRATQASAESTALSGFAPVDGRPVVNPTLVAAVSAFRVNGGITLLAALIFKLILDAEWWLVGYALAAALCAHLFLYLPAMLYRPPSPRMGVQR